MSFETVVISRQAAFDADISRQHEPQRRAYAEPPLPPPLITPPPQPSRESRPPPATNTPLSF